jgi:hypothetical protein
MTFGCYCLGNIGHAMYTFRDCPEAYQELMVVCIFLPGIGFPKLHTTHDLN